ncbi:hypothetical protein WICPIJ_002595 [Wickerhamomyces pijperi]|uniref:Uncharacterized protein n=1 Tax=Wickerhamomyces pijperi TaxID=599730 RepID=A0A9P8TPH7_WICPI|nr:hypothetical protein WICPIJ_002595 [Wickerhamomyces pijperi]
MEYDACTNRAKDITQLTNNRSANNDTNRDHRSDSGTLGGRVAQRDGEISQVSLHHIQIKDLENRLHMAVTGLDKDNTNPGANGTDDTLNDQRPS